MLQQELIQLEHYVPASSSEDGMELLLVGEVVSVSLRQHSCSAYHQGLHYHVTMVRHPFQRLDHEGISPAWLSYSRGHLLHDLKIWRSQRHECSRQPFAPFQLADLACCIAMI